MKSSATVKSYRIALLLFTLAVAPAARAEGPILPAGVKVVKDISYVPGGHGNQKLDLFLPAKPTGPLLVCIHGGAWRSGSKNDAQGIEMVALGYTVANIEYRFSQHAIFPAQIEDCKAAIRWLRAHAGEYGYDPERIGALGGSAGGHLVALLATTGKKGEFDVGEHLDQSSAIRCGVDFFGPTDFPNWIPPTDIPLVQRSGKGSCLEELFGGPLDDRLELATKASPAHWVTKDTAPLFIVHGTKDPLVGPEQSEDFSEKLKAVGVEVTLDMIEGGGHGGAEFYSPDRLANILAFLNRHLAAAE